MSEYKRPSPTIAVTFPNRQSSNHNFFFFKQQLGLNSQPFLLSYFTELRPSFFTFFHNMDAFEKSLSECAPLSSFIPLTVSCPSLTAGFTTCLWVWPLGTFTFSVQTTLHMTQSVWSIMNSLWSMLMLSNFLLFRWKLRATEGSPVSRMVSNSQTKNVSGLTWLEGWIPPTERNQTQRITVKEMGWLAMKRGSWKEARKILPSPPHEG